MEEPQAASSGLFAVFLLSIYSLFLIPYTIYRLCGAEDEATTQPVVKSKKKASPADKLKRWCTKGNLVLLALWVLWFGMVSYSQASMSSMKPFDPFEILGVPREANERDIKKAYRKLSLVYHPDKNPDPKAAAYFASHITKAYAALTDEASRQNYEKYGHPDGPQGMNLGIALPQWMFSKDKKAAPLMLLGLVGGGILLPLGLMSWYMLSSSKFTGPNQILNETYGIFMYSKYAIKESQSLVRIPETLLCAMEFITLYTPAEHGGPMEELRKLVGPSYGELMARSNKTFWGRKASVVKAHMLLLAHLERLGPEVPPALQADLKYMRTKAPALLEEMVKLATLPRPPNGLGWMTPAVSCVEMMQCIAQALPVAVRKGGGKGESAAPLLQLPGVDAEVAKKLRKRKVNSLADLLALPEGARSAELAWAGLSVPAVEGVVLFLSALPSLSLAAKLEVEEGEAEAMEGDVVHCRVRLLLRRPSHRTEGYALRGSAVRAYMPANPVARDEGWYIFITEPSSNSVLAWTKANLMEAERAGLASPLPAAGGQQLLLADASSNSSAAASKGGAKAAPGGGPGESAGADGLGGGQLVDLAFGAPRPGNYNLSLLVMSDCWVGVDEALPLKLKVAPLTRAAAEERDAARARAAEWSESGSDAGSDASGSSAGGSEEEDAEDYDSEETGEEESEGSDNSHED